MRRIQATYQWKVAEIASPSVVGMMIVGILLLLSTMALFSMSKHPRAQQLDDSIRVYCAAGLVEPVNMVLSRFEREFGMPVVITRSGGSGMLFGQVQLEVASGFQKGADLYVAADHNLMIRGIEAGVIAESFALGRQRPVIAVRAGSPYRVSDLPELIATARYGIASEQAAIGELVRRLAQEKAVLDELLSRRTMEAENVMQLAHALQTSNVDAAVLWDTTVVQLNRESGDKSLQIAAYLSLPSSYSGGDVSVGVVQGTLVPTAAAQVASFLAEPDNRQIFGQFGFDVSSVQD